MPHRLLQFWAKTFPPTDAAPAYKPVLHHLLDVAAVAAAYLRANPARLARESALCGAEPADYLGFVGFLAGLHDLGKFARNFQAKVAALWPEALGEKPRAPLPGPPHWRATGLLLQLEPLRAEFAALTPSLSGGGTALLAAIAGHHGRPPPFGEDSDKAAQRALAKGQWLDRIGLDAAHVSFQRLRELTGARPVAALDDDKAPEFSWRLSGLITLADWVGSDAAFFPPRQLETPLSIYWADAGAAAAHAIAAKGLAALKPAASPSLSRLAPRAAASPRPMQQLAQELKLSDGPQLVLIEDATGSGKTEAALLIAARMISAGLGEGVYFALPTMATANAMHRRLDQIAPRLFASDAREPSIILSHGNAKISAALASAEGGDGEETTASKCNAWIADDRRRAFFADVGAGTIDQAFLAVLPKKYLTLRQYALAGRVLIVDEAHCFDAYMKEELGALLRLHAMNGGSAIVLSATLSLSARQKLAQNYYEGLGRPHPAKDAAAGCRSPGYPLLTLLDRTTKPRECASPLDPRLARRVAVERLANREAALTNASLAADAGAAVLIVCNAVDEAIRCFLDLVETRGAGALHLFHARFAQGDRIAIEDAVLNRFGRDAKAADRAGHILVATQVVEQSLDLDFDLIVSDLAPIDLLIQRAGRLWRHLDLRPAQGRAIAQPKLLVVSPDPETVANANWLAPCLGRAAHVYADAGVMWRTARVLFSAGSLATPEDLRPMIEAVYGERCVALPECLEGAQMRGAGKSSMERALGAFNVIDLARGYGHLPSDLRTDENIGTRLGEATLSIRLSRREDGELAPWVRSGGGAGLDWALSELKVRKSFWARAEVKPQDRPLQDRAKKAWSEWEDGIVLAEVGESASLVLDNERFSYSPVLGLHRSS